VKIGRNDPCFCGSGKKHKKCHGALLEAPKPARRRRTGPQILLEGDLAKMRRACRLAANILEKACALIQPGTTTEEINSWIHRMTVDAGAYPSPLNYPRSPTDPEDPVIDDGAFPKSVCTSINNVVCHGIPRPTDVLKDGDIVNIDVTVTLDGFYGDTSRTVYVGTPSPAARAVTETARECLELGIAAVRCGGRLIDIGAAILAHADARGMGVVRDFTGHGIGRVFHGDPQVCHYPNKDLDCELIPGMTFTIEPMINEGTWQVRIDKSDNWTVFTADGKLSAQFEHTINVNENGAEILTIPD